MNKTLPGFFNLTESTVYRIQPLKETVSFKSIGLLRRIQQTKSGKMVFMNLLCRCPVGHHNCGCLIEPSRKNFAGVLNFLDYRFSEISQAYRIQYHDPGRRPIFQLGNYYCIEADKVVLSSNQSDYSIMALHSGGKLGLMNSGDEKWTIKGDFFDQLRFDDIVSHKGKLYAVENTGKVISIDFSGEKLSSQIALPLPGNSGHKKHLVSCGDLILVERYYTEIFDEYWRTVTSGFKVFKLNTQHRKWVEIKTLGGEILILGDDISFSISAKDFSGSKGNCIYFTESYYNKLYQNDYKLNGLCCRCIGVFNVENGCLGPLESFPGYSDIFWPPLPWFRLTSTGSSPKGLARD
ncbi:hypothetical protein ACFE04_015607 [Oxalis oulophora]